MLKIRYRETFVLKFREKNHIDFVRLLTSVYFVLFALHIKN